jgi:hypothetical protein
MKMISRNHQGSLMHGEHNQEMTNLRVVPKHAVMNILLRRAAGEFIEAKALQRTIIWVENTGPHSTFFQKGRRRLPHEFHCFGRFAIATILVVDAREEQGIKSNSRRQQCCLRGAVTFTRVTCDVCRVTCEER